MAKHSVLICRFPYHGDEKFTVGDWLAETLVEMKADPRVGDIPKYPPIDDTPIPMSRNRACRDAQRMGIDLVLMVDSDMAPDLRLPGAKRFWKSSFDFVLQQPEPVIVAAPYCGPPPHENCYIFRWATYRTEPAAADFRLAQYTREEAAIRAGFEEVAALPTGLILFPTKALDKVPLPWFDYEYTDKYRTHKSTTEDVYFTRNASLKGVKVYCNWDAWAGHWKQLVVKKPQLLTPEQVGKELRDALLRPAADERMVDVTPEGVAL